MLPTESPAESPAREYHASIRFEQPYGQVSLSSQIDW